jgi:hypothetical protein
MNSQELDEVLERLPEAEFDAFLEAVNSDRRYRTELHAAAAGTVFMPIAIAALVFPFVRPSLTDFPHRLAFAAFPFALLLVFYLLYRSVARWCARRADYRQARRQGLIK